MFTRDFATTAGMLVEQPAHYIALIQVSAEPDATLLTPVDHRNRVKSVHLLSNPKESSC
jgi:hypothetical protein